MKLAFLISFLGLLPFSGYAELSVHEVKSPQGFSFWHMENPKTPMVGISFAFPNGGGSQDPTGKKGLAQLASSMAFEGAGPYSDHEFKKQLDGLGATIVLTPRPEHLEGLMLSLSDNLEGAEKLLISILKSPKFPKKNFDHQKQVLITGVKAQEKEPEFMGMKTIYKTILGSWGELPTVTSLQMIQESDIRQYWTRTIIKDGLQIVVAGNISSKEAGLMVDRLFSSLPSGKGLPLKKPNLNFSGETLRIDHDTPQSLALWMQPGIPRSDKRFIATHILDEILGGGFESLLFQEVREKRGLTYSIGTSFTPFKEFGYILGNVASDPDKIDESIKIMKQVWTEVKEKGVTEQQFKDTQTHMIGSFPMTLTSTMGMLKVLMSFKLGGYPVDYLKNRTKIIESITLEEVNQTAKEILDPSKITTVVVGKTSPKKS